MKRGGPLRRKTPLRSFTSLKRGLPKPFKPLKRSASLRTLTPLKSTRKPRVRPEEAAAALAWHETVTRHPCAVCGRTRSQAIQAGTWLEAHHLIPQRTLKKRGRRDLLWSNALLGLSLCSYPCHSNHETRSEPVRREHLTKDAIALIEAEGFGDVLDRYYP